MSHVDSWLATAETLIGALIARRSCARHSLAAWAANFEIVYGPENVAGTPKSAAPFIVTTTGVEVTQLLPTRFTFSTPA